MRPRDDDGAAPLRGGARYWWVAALLLACALSWGTLDSPWIAEDAAILAHVHEAGPAEDLLSPQYGLSLVRFWRPVVSLSWWVQERLTGIEPSALRSFNLGLHGLAAVLVGLLVRRLGGSASAAFLAAALAATFPAQGGTVTWLAGRTDGLVGVLLLATLLSAVSERRLLSAVFVGLACATKEFAFVLPAWIALAVWARAGRLAPAWRAAWPAALVTVGALLLRRVAVGSFTGGYAGGAGGLTLLGALHGLAHAARGVAPLLLLLGALAVVGFLARTLRWRVLVAGLGLALTATLPLLPLLDNGPLGAQNVRLFWVVELGLVIAVAGTILTLEARAQWRSLAALVVLSIGLGLRAAEARSDVLEWSEAGQVGEQAVSVARARAARAEPSRDPLFWDGFPGTHRGAYCLGFGLADRFRAPFPPSVRPVWPARTLFVDDSRLRPRIARPDAGGFRDPFDAGARSVPLLVASVDGAPFEAASATAAIPVDERVPDAAVDRSPRLTIAGARAGTGLEFVLLTEAGIESALGGTFDAAGRASLSLSELCRLPNDVATLGQALMQTADLGATAAYLEVRAVEADGSVSAATFPLRLEWEADLLDRLDL